MENKNKYIIVDWANNPTFGEFTTFETFEDAWEFLLEKFESDEDLQEFYVVDYNEFKKFRL